MKKTTFFVVEICGPAYPIPRGNDARNWGLYEKSGTISYGHRPGAWSADALRKLAARCGATLRSAYWSYYSPRHGFSGATQYHVAP